MKTRSRTGTIMALIVAAVVLAACQQHPESAGSRATGPYGGVEGGVGF